MNETMIERVAKAIWAANCRVRNDERQKFDDLSVRSKADLRMYARAAIEAMKEPTQKMIDAADLEELKNGPELTALIYTKSIEAALSEGERS